MDLYQLYEGAVRCEKDIRAEFDSYYDVIVAGLGTAGAIAAVCSAEHGLNTLGLEKQHMMGGTATCGQVLGYYYGSRGGRFEETDRIVINDDTDLFIPANKRFPDHILPEKKNAALEEEAIKAGVHLRYEAYIEGVYLNEKQVIGVLWRDKDGLRRSSAKYVIDCTGEAKICAMIGCERMRGRLFDNKTQPWSLSTLKLDFCTVKAQYVDVGYINADDAKTVSEEILNCYTGPMFLREHYDAEDFFNAIAPVIGIREGSTIKGEETLTFTGFLSGKITEHPLFYAFSNVDTHSIEHAFESDAYLAWRVISGLHMLNFAVPVPKGALIPKGYKGILVAGRCIAVDHDISPAVRMKRDMQKCGEAAAAVAYLSIRDKTDAVHTNDRELEEILRSTGCLDEDNNKMSYLIAEKWTGEKITVPVQWLTNIDEIRQTMTQDNFGVGIWSAVRIGSRIQEHLREWLKDDNKSIAICSAFALGLLGDRSSLDIIRRRIALLPGYTDGAPVFQQRRDHAAICLAGMLNDTESVPAITEILYLSLNDTEHIQYCFFAIAALVRIFENCSDDVLKKSIKESLDDVVSSGQVFKITLNGKFGIYSDITEQVHKFIKRVL